MARHQLKVRSRPWHMRTATLGQWAAECIEKVPGVSDVRIVEDGQDLAVLDYECEPGGGTDRIDELLLEGGAEQVWDDA